MKAPRWLAFLAFLPIAGAASANMTQVYDKTITSWPSPSITGVAIDNSDNVYAAGFTGDNAFGAFVKKLSPTGATLWTKTFASHDNPAVQAIVLDASGSLYLLISSYDRKALTVRKLRTSDGASLASYEPPETDYYIQANNDELVLDAAGSLFVVAERRVASSPLVRITRLNTADLSVGTVREVAVPEMYYILKARPAPGSGLAVLTGGQREFERRFPQSILLNVPASGAIGQTAVGYGSALVFDPATGEAVCLGTTGDSLGLIVQTRLPIAGPLASTATITTNDPLNYFKDAVITKEGRIVAFGAVQRQSGPVEEYPYLCHISSGTGKGFPDALSDQNFYSAAIDNYGDITAASSCYNARVSALYEVDEYGRGYFHTGDLSFIAAGHAMGPLGTTVIAGEGRVVVYKPRDLKDIYLGSNSLKGGSSATAIIRMYQAYTSDRVVNLSDDSSHVTIAASKTVAAGQTQVSATVLTTAVTSSQPATLTATYGIMKRTFSFTLTPN